MDRNNYKLTLLRKILNTEGYFVFQWPSECEKNSNAFIFIRHHNMPLYHIMMHLKQDASISTLQVGIKIQFTA